MPKEISHWLLAEKAFQKLEDSSALKDIIRGHKNLYLIGAVIADTPFYCRIFGPGQASVVRWGEVIHDNPVNSYAPIVNVIRRFPHVPDNVLAFLLGVITHIHADSSFHPMVYYITGNPVHPEGRETARIRHQTFETFLDIYYREGFYLQNRGKLSELLRNAEMEETSLLNLLSVFFSGEHGMADRLKIKNALRTHAAIQKLFDKNALKIMLGTVSRIPGVNLNIYKSLVYPLRKPEPGSMFLRPLSYRHPVTGVEYRSLITEPEEAAIRNTLDVFGIIGHHIGSDSFSEVFSGLRGPDLYTGMVGYGKSDMRYFSEENDLMNLILPECKNEAE